MNPPRHQWIRPLIPIAIFSICLSDLASAHTDTQVKSSHDSKTPCLEKKLTPQNSYLQDFGGGAVLHIPRCLIPGLQIKDPSKPIKAGSLSMVFWFPDMTLTMWKPPMDYFLDEAKHKKYIPQRNRFRVDVITMFYTKGSYQPDPTPHQIEKNMAVIGSVQRIPTPYPGLMAEVSKSWIKKHPDAAKFNVNIESRFAETPNSPYDLYMTCDPPTKVIAGDNCRAYVYEKKHQFQCFMKFPHEAMPHTDALIRSIDLMIDRWWGS